MATYLITGVSRGLGFEFLRQLSENTANTIIGIVRDKKATEEKVAAELGKRDNVRILQADMTDYESLKALVRTVTEITGGSLDFIIANAGLISRWSAHDAIGYLGEQPTHLEEDLLESFKVNVVGNIHLFNLFMPLILKGNAKKVITITSGLADNDLTAKYDLEQAAPYSISKAAMNCAIAKFSAQYRQDGVLFLGICPGAVNTGQYDGETDEQMAKAMTMFAKFKAYAPGFTGHTTPDLAIKDVLSVMNNASVSSGHGGAFVSHLGNKQWL